MQINTKEHQDLIAQFEKQFRGEGRFDKEEKNLWKSGNIYQDGYLNKLFVAFRVGIAYGLVLGRESVAA